MKSFPVTILLSFLVLQRLPAQPPQGSGPWSAGVFMMLDSQPYVGAGRNVRVYPSISYRGERLVWNGPLLQYNVKRADSWDISVHGLVQFAPYEEDDAEILEGMGDRSDTLLGGLDWTYRPLPFLVVLASVDAEILGAYEGWQGTLGAQYMLGRPWKTFSGSLGAGLLLQDQNWTRYFVGVPAAKATPSRPVYQPEESFHPYLSAQLLIRLGDRWSWFTLSRVEFLDETWRDSPLISKDYRLVAFTALNYSF